MLPADEVDRSSQALEVLSRQATKCRICFETGVVGGAAIGVAQPRWVGPRYWKSTPRVVILMLNPGGGGKRFNSDHETYGKNLQEFQSGATSLRQLLDEQGKEIPRWGSPSGKFISFYEDGLGLSLEDVAFANIAWCSSAGDSYPRTMLDECFRRHTRQLLSILNPRVLVASGSKVAAFCSKNIPSSENCTVIRIPHFAHRGSHARATEALRLAREQLTMIAANG